MCILPIVGEGGGEGLELLVSLIYGGKEGRGGGGEGGEGKEKKGEKDTFP